MEGPSKAEISFEDRKDGSCGVSYIVQEPGDYEVSIKFNDEHIPDSPFIVPIASVSDDARRLTVTSLQVRCHPAPQGVQTQPVPSNTSLFIYIERERERYILLMDKMRPHEPFVMLSWVEATTLFHCEHAHLWES